MTDTDLDTILQEHNIKWEIDKNGEPIRSDNEHWIKVTCSKCNTDYWVDKRYFALVCPYCTK